MMFLHCCGKKAPWKAWNINSKSAVGLRFSDLYVICHNLKLIQCCQWACQYNIVSDSTYAFVCGFSSHIIMKQVLILAWFFKGGEFKEMYCEVKGIRSSQPPCHCVHWVQYNVQCFSFLYLSFFAFVIVCLNSNGILNVRNVQLTAQMVNYTVSFDLSLS